MQVSASGVQRSSALRASSKRSRQYAARVVCQAEMGRRQLLSAAGTALVASGASSLVLPRNAHAELSSISVEQLGLLQRKDQLTTFRQRVERTIREYLTAADAPAALRLVLNDAVSYDPVTKSGGLNGSIVLANELGRPENQGLAPVVEKLAQAKKQIDADGEKDGSGPISWADLLVLAAKTTTQESWKEIKIGRAALASGGAVIAGPAFAASWPVRLGRIDSDTPSPEGRIPAQGASVADIKNYMLTVGVGPDAKVGGFFGPKPPFYERPTFVLWTAAAADPTAEEVRFAVEDPKAFAGWKTSYDRSRKTVTRTDYEVDFIDYFTQLANLGANFRKDAYLHPEQVQGLL